MATSDSPGALGAEGRNTTVAVYDHLAAAHKAVCRISAESVQTHAGESRSAA